jgi:hypothetical protein
MRKSLVVGLIVILVVVILAGYFVWSYYESLNPVYPTQAQVRDQAMSYIKAHYSETAQYMQNLSWTGGDITPHGLVGASRYAYQSGSWNVTLQYPVVPNPIYTVNATYTSQGIIINWQGTIQDSNVTETSYEFSSNKS